LIKSIDQIVSPHGLCAAGTAALYALVRVQILWSGMRIIREGLVNTALLFVFSAAAWFVAVEDLVREYETG
jgi:hypothetical protein